MSTESLDELFRLNTGQWRCGTCRTLNEGTDSERCRACETMKSDTLAAPTAAEDGAGRGTEAATSAPAPTASIGATGFVFGAAQPPAADAGRVPVSNGRPLAAAAGGFAFAPVPAATDAVAPVPAAAAFPTAAFATTGAPADGLAPTAAAPAPAGFSFPNVGTDTAPPPAAVPGLPLGGQNPMVAQQQPQQQLAVVPAADGVDADVMSAELTKRITATMRKFRRENDSDGNLYEAYTAAMEAEGRTALSLGEWKVQLHNAPTSSTAVALGRIKLGHRPRAAIFGYREGTQPAGPELDDDQAIQVFNRYVREWEARRQQ